MKTLALAALLMCSVAAWSEQPNPAEYPLTVHVVRSYLTVDFHRGTLQILDVLINGKRLQLEGNQMRLSPLHYGLISIGDYKAKLTRNGHKSTYLTDQEYEILFPDQEIKDFEVIGESE